MLGGDADGSFSDAGSRWGIKGSTEVSEGLTAVYKFETRVNTSSKDPNQSTKQMYAGLSGGFGSLTLGKFHNAAQNHSGGIRDIGYWYSSGDAPTNTGNTVSYAFSSDAASFQLDAIMDGGIDTGKSIDQVQFGMSVNLGDIGKVALGYVEVEDTVMPAGMADDKDMPAMKDPDPMDDPMDDPMEMMPKRNAMAITVYASTDTARSTPIIIQANKATVVKYSHTTTGGVTTELDLYEVPSGSSYYGVDADKSIKADAEADTFDPEKTMGEESDSAVVTVVEKADTEARIIGGELRQADQITVVTRTVKDGDSTSDPATYYKVAKEKKYYRVNDSNPAADATNMHQEYTYTDGEAEGTAPAAFDSDTLTAVYEEQEEEPQTAEPDPAPADPAPTPDPAPADATDAADGYTSTHVSVQLNLGAVTLGLGYSEKESNAKGSMDEKTTYVGASGSIGDTGMGWRAWTRDVSNSGNTKGDANPWGIGINKDLGGGAFTFVEHHNADNDKSGNTIIALGVNF